MKKNILIIAYAYPPNNVAGAQRPYALAKHLDKNKFRVTVITCENPNSALGINTNFDERLNNVDLIKIKSFVGSAGQQKVIKSANKDSRKFNLKQIHLKLGQAMIFPDKGMFWYPNVIRYLKQNPELIKTTDVIFSSSPGVTNHRIARWVKRNNPGIKWIADFRDFNYVGHWEEQKGLKAYLHGNLEKSIVKESSVMTFVTKTMQDAYQAFYPSLKDKMYNVYNGFAANEFHTPQESTMQSESLSFFYAGTFYGGIRSPHPLLMLLDQALNDGLLDINEVKVNIAGNIEEDIINDLKVYTSYRCINFLGSIPRSQVLAQMTDATFLWLILGNIKSHYETIPIKLFEYVAARRPVINFAPAISEASEIVRMNNLGYNIDTLKFELEESYTIFKKLIDDFREGMFRSALPAENLEKFTWETQINKLEEIIGR